MKIKDKVLIVEDEQSISNFISMILTANGYDTIIVRSGEEALTMIASHCPDMIVLDLGLPDMDGMEVLKSVRKWSNLPVVVVSARNHEHDKVEALDYGADDYLVKPFEMKELMARVKANIRRRSMEYAPAQSTAGQIEADGLCLNPETYQGTKNGSPVELTEKEYDLLSYLIRERGKVFSREDLMQRVWNYDYYGDMRTVDVTVRRLREKIEDDPGKPQYILTRRGVGYYFAG